MKRSGLRVFTLMLLVVALTFIGCKVKHPCKVEMGETKNGTIYLEQDLPEDKLVENGSELDFRAIPDEGYVVGSWTIEGGEFVEGGEAGSKTAKIKITDNFEISVSFVEVYTVSFNVHGVNGNIAAAYGENYIEPSTIENVPVNTEITFTATPVENYEVDFWTIEGGSITSGGTNGATTAVVKITEDVSVSVSFVIKKYNVTFSVDSENSNGSLKVNYDGATYNPQTISNIPANTEITFTATPDADYSVDSWTIIGGSFSSGGEARNTTAEIVVNSNLTVSVSFIDKGKFSVGDVSFLMKKVDAVTDTTLGDSGQSHNQPHQVSLSEYWIGEIEVTQELWEEVMGSNPSNFQGDGNPPDGDEVQEKRPVEKVSWYDCIAFCNELTKKVYGEGTEECMYYDSVDNSVYTVEDAIAEKVPLFDINDTKKGFRLPTEAEWEYAAKGGDTYTYSGSATIDDVAWFKDNSNSKTHQVKMKAPNGYGLYDMTGNVLEWCFDFSATSNQPVSGDNPVGLSGAGTGTTVLIRGGSWGNILKYCVLAFRNRTLADSKFDICGLRLTCRL